MWNLEFPTPIRTSSGWLQDVPAATNVTHETRQQRSIGGFREDNIENMLQNKEFQGMSFIKDNLSFIKDIF